MTEYRQTLFPYAYNILGSSEDAKDAIQDVLVKYYAAGGNTNRIENPTGYLIKAVVNQSINIKKKKTRTVSDSMWLPEPVATEEADNNIIKSEIVSYSLLVLLEKLTPKERAVFILKTAFDYSHDEIAALVEISIENARKILSRAKNKLSKYKTKTPFARAVLKTSAYMEAYVRAIRNGDTKKLEQMLADDISLAADGGGKVKVVKELTIGKAATLDLLVFVFETYQKSQKIKIARVNDQPALFFYTKKKLAACQVFELEGEKIRRIYAVLDPKKLKSPDSKEGF